MMYFHTDWKVAHNEAQARANSLGRATGIEKCDEYGRTGFRVLNLPRPENRQGFELRCEVVEPSNG